MQDVYDELHQEALRAVEHLNLAEKLYEVCDDKTYDELYALANVIATKINGRVVITLPDGHVVIDTYKEGNTYKNYIQDIIGDNHNTRVCIFQAQYDEKGIGYERKLSSTTGQIETYFALRLGEYRNSAGTLRLSKVS